MRAAVIAAPREVRLEAAAVPEPGPGHVLVRLEGSGVCGSNLPLWEGRPWFRYPVKPGDPGHEGWGEVVALGPNVDGIAVGTRVAAMSDFAFAEYDVAPARAVVPLPEELDGKPFPGEALGCAMNVLARSGIRSGETVAVVGVGFLGALLVQLAARAGARVIAITRRSYARELARELGAGDVLSLEDALDAVTELTDGALCDCVIEAAGKQETLDLAGTLTRVRGRLIVAGYHQEPRQVDMKLWNWRGLDVVNAHERDPAVYAAGMRAAVDAVVRRELDPWPLLTHTFPLERLGDALDIALARPDGFMKALVLT